MADQGENSNYTMLKRQSYLSLTDIAYNSLIEAIINQGFQPGAPISIDSLARQLNMSNTPVREALMRAHGERLVTQKTNHGFVVANILTPVELHQLFDVRHVLEIHALTEAKISPESVETVKSLVEQMQTSSDGKIYDDFRDYMALDNQFHYALVKLEGNSFLLEAWDDLHVHLHLSRLYIGVGLFDRDHSTQEHQAIVAALQEGDKKKAISLLSQHIKRVEKRMSSFLEK
ncbi:MAG: GntR family transcriptional regulator [Chloroflexota bacterium]